MSQTVKSGGVRRAAAAVASAATGASWMALVAATTIGVSHVDLLRAEIRGDNSSVSTRVPHRLVVQCYAPGSMRAGQLDQYARPLGSAQRAITDEELQRGISVDVLQFGEDTDVKDRVVVAWVEPGEPTLEYDALRARPSANALVGVTEAHEASAQIVLKRTT